MVTSKSTLVLVFRTVNIKNTNSDNVKKMQVISQPEFAWQILGNPSNNIFHKNPSSEG
jgi:hypothetical protein